MKTINQLISQVKSTNALLDFNDVMSVISNNYHYEQSAFSNGELENQAGTNEGSCKVFAFAKLNNLSEQETLNCFGQYYREDVIKNPSGNDHGNIRNFMKSGWSGITFDSFPLKAK
ncbi:HopJ type III effector protein [Colwelliaceae bacterium 6441]